VPLPHPRVRTAATNPQTNVRRVTLLNVRSCRSERSAQTPTPLPPRAKRSCLQGYSEPALDQRRQSRSALLSCSHPPPSSCPSSQRRGLKSTALRLTAGPPSSAGTFPLEPDVHPDLRAALLLVVELAAGGEPVAVLPRPPPRGDHRRRHLDVELLSSNGRSREATPNHLDVQGRSRRRPEDPASAAGRGRRPTQTAQRKSGKDNSPTWLACLLR
jgi:hypothetical protein